MKTLGTLWSELMVEQAFSGTAFAFLSAWLFQLGGLEYVKTTTLKVEGICDWVTSYEVEKAARVYLSVAETSCPNFGCKQRATSNDTIGRIRTYFASF